MLGYNLRFSDRPTRAIAAFRRVLELDAKNTTAREFLSDLEAKPAAPAPASEKADGKGASIEVTPETTPEAKTGKPK